MKTFPLIKGKPTLHEQSRHASQIGQHHYFLHKSPLKLVGSHLGMNFYRDLGWVEDSPIVHLLRPVSGLDAGRWYSIDNAINLACENDHIGGQFDHVALQAFARAIWLGQFSIWMPPTYHRQLGRIERHFEPARLP